MARSGPPIWFFGLKLLNTGDFRAIGEWRGLSFEGRWCWWLKKRIDLDFVAQYQQPVGILERLS
jgi:NADH dehydrogenase FAD-containing subunit